MESVLVTLFQSRDFAHFKHLETDSLSAHKALQHYYEDVIDVLDKYAELLMSNGQKIQCPKSIEIPEKDAVVYFEAFGNTLNTLTKDTSMREDLRQCLIDALTLVNTLLYKLKGLK